MKTKTNPLLILLQINVYLINTGVWSQRDLGRFQEVFAWKQITFDIDGYLVLQDRFGDDIPIERTKRQSSDTVFFGSDEDDVKNWDLNSSPGFNFSEATTTVRPADEAGRFFIQYNNVPMGMEKVGDILFVSIPRRRYGIPATLNYIDLKRDSHTRSPSLRPYPNLRQARSLTSVYRTRADECGRLWMVDTGLLEIPGAPRQVQAPGIVIYDLATNQQIMRYTFKSSDIIAANTPTGLASITIDIVGDCRNAYAYVPDLTTFGLIVYSLRENDSWRLSHNYFHLSPTAGNLRVAGKSFIRVR
ncbi:unnamed protein product [Parnassius mnemosyne]|uniref:Uncharacterized protein n=1 Tax=Parnassius mnemosyne TaxID=213953 RepID=A0AAV1LDW1_9NEOP